MLNERTRAFADSAEGKKYQCMIFQFIYDHRVKMLAEGDGKFEWMARVWIEAKMKQLHPDLDHDKFMDAIHRLEEHGLIKAQYFGRGEDIRIMKKGWDRWERKGA